MLCDMTNSEEEALFIELRQHIRNTALLSGNLELSKNILFMSHCQTGSHGPCCKGFWESVFLAGDH